MDRMLDDLPKDQQISGSTETTAKIAAEGHRFNLTGRQTKNDNNITHSKPKILGFWYSICIKSEACVCACVSVHVNTKKGESAPVIFCTANTHYQDAK